MNNTLRKKCDASSQRTPTGKSDARSRFEWPLLAFPVALLATLAILYVANRSIERQFPADATPAPATPAGVHTPDPTESPGHPAMPVEEHTRTLAPVHPVTGQGPEASAIGSHPRTVQETQAGDPVQEAAVASNGVGQPGAAGELEGPAAIIAILREAAAKGDHARIKQALDELVALGDPAIAPLTELIAESNDSAGLWATEALARIGTPLATDTLLETLSQIKEGPYKEEIAKRVSTINNHESWPVLLDRILDTGDATVLRAAATSLSKMADQPVVDEIAARYDAAVTERDVTRLTELIRNISSPKATDALLALAGDVSATPQDAVARAAIDALAKTGEPQAVSYLLRKLEASAPGEGGYLFNTIEQIDEPQARASLVYAAAGNKEVSAEHGRTAAIYALKNFPDEDTCVLLEQIAANEENARVVAAAIRTLDNIRQTSPHPVAKAESLVKKDPVLNPLRK